MMQNSVAFYRLSATGFCTAHVIDLVPAIFCRTDVRLRNTPCLGRFERYRLTGPIWARLFHIRPETYRSALAVIINAHLTHPYAKLWGNGTTSSSDGQFFRAAGRGAKRSDVNAHYSGDPGSKFYTWVSDQHGHFHILPMGATEDEAVYVLDGIYGHESRIEIDEHYVDTGGASDHVFSLFALGGKRVAPRLRDLKDWRLHTFEGADVYPTLKHHIGDRID